MGYFFNENENRVYQYDFVPSESHYKQISDAEGTWAFNQYRDYKFPSYQEIKNQGSARPSDDVIIDIAKDIKQDEIREEIDRRKNITGTFTLSTGKTIGLSSNDNVIDNLMKIKSVLQDQIELGLFNPATDTYNNFFDDLNGNTPFPISYQELLEIRLNIASKYEDIREFEKIKNFRLLVATTIEEIIAIDMLDEDIPTNNPGATGSN